MSGVGAPNSTEPYAPTIQGASLHFLEQARHTQSVSTATIYQQALNIFTKFLSTQTSINPGQTLLSQLPIETYRTFLLYLQDTYSPETEHSYFRAITAFVSASAKHTDIEPAIITQLRDLTHKIRRKKQKQDPEIPHKRIAQIRPYLETIGLPEPDPETTIQRERLRLLRDKALIFTIMDTGLKPSEITCLRIQDVDHNIPAIMIQGFSLPLVQSTMRAIQNYLRERLPVDQQQLNLPYPALALFARHDKRAGTKTLSISRWTVGNIISYWARLASEPSSQDEQPVTPSLLRHHFVVSTLATTDNLKLTQQRARHKDKGTTRQYLHRRSQTTTD